MFIQSLIMGLCSISNYYNLWKALYNSGHHVFITIEPASAAIFCEQLPVLNSPSVYSEMSIFSWIKSALNSHLPGVLFTLIGCSDWVLLYCTYGPRCCCEFAEFAYIGLTLCTFCVARTFRCHMAGLVCCLQCFAYHCLHRADILHILLRPNIQVPCYGWWCLLSIVLCMPCV